MPQRLEPSDCFFTKGHLKSNSQQAPHRLHSPRRRARAAIISCLRKLVFISRRIFPWAWRARSFASSILRERSLSASRSSKECCLAIAAARSDFIEWLSSTRSELPAWGPAINWENEFCDTEHECGADYLIEQLRATNPKTVYTAAAPLTCLSIIREIASFDVAPTTRSSSLPPLKRISVGIPLIP